MNHNRTKLLLAPLAATALIFSVTACGSDDDTSSDTTEMTTATSMADDMTEMDGGEATVGDLTVTGVWMREPAEGQTRSAAYGTITNNGDADVTLVAASVPFDATVEIHAPARKMCGTVP